MKRLSLAILCLLTLCSCGGSKNSSDSSPATSNEDNSGKQPQPADSINSKEEAFCPFVEMAGLYRVTKVECSVDRREDVPPDLNVVPMIYRISTHGNIGKLDLIFVDADGNEKSEISLEFPRTPTNEDFKKDSTQCGNLPTSKSLTQGCPGLTSSCAYSISESNGKFVGAYYRFLDNKLYACRSELNKDN